MARCLTCKDTGVVKTNWGNRFCDCREGQNNQQQVENAKVDQSGSVAGYMPTFERLVLQGLLLIIYFLDAGIFEKQIKRKQLAPQVVKFAQDINKLIGT